ncbi:VanW family protein [Clostridium rectalis]|uniref:VanW family protein n=1 Tax=Clostridium rectalis TaxID=2040295 RepID=UPI001FAA1ADF|nr:VanW family protein [Clostridium rectalis]
MLLETNTETSTQNSRRKKRKSKNKKKMPIIIVSILIFALVVTAITKGISMYMTLSKYNDLVYPNVYVNNINIGGKTKDEALTILSQNYKNGNLKRNINITVNDKKYSLNFSKLDMQYNFEEVVNTAFNYEKDKGAFERYKAIREPKPMKLDLKYKYSLAEVDKLIKQIENENNKNAVDATITKVGEGFNVTSEQSGRKVDKDNIKKQIDKNMDINSKGDISIKAIVKEVKPNVTADVLKTINTRISSFPTSYTTSNSNRSTNIELCTRTIDKKLVMPGETFSFNDTTGERGEKNGYKPAKVIVGDKFVDDFGGGVCQVSSTLYNAILRANILPTERTHHTFASTYVPLGMDATVDYGNIDYKFKNTLPYPIYIEGVINNKTVTFNIYSNSSLTNRRYDLVNEVNGNKVSVYKVTYENGKQTSKILVSTDVYKEQ